MVNHTGTEKGPGLIFKPAVRNIGTMNASLIQQYYYKVRRL